MATRILSIAAIAIIATTFGGCEMIGDILQFGIWVGVIFMVVVIGLLYWLFSKFRR